ncbi:MAG: tetratricopeptide repeat protein [Candidatus Thorarchaeota archaeon]
MSPFRRKKKLPRPAFAPFEEAPGIGISKTISGDLLTETRRGFDLIKRGHYTEAERVLKAIAEKYKDDNYLAVMGLSDALLLQHNFEDAEELYRACIELNPITARSRYGLVLVLRWTGREKEAMEHEKLLRKLLGGPLGSDLPDYLPPFEEEF